MFNALCDCSWNDKFTRHRAIGDLTTACLQVTKALFGWGKKKEASTPTAAPGKGRDT